MKFNGLNDYIEMDNLNLLPTKGKGSGDEMFVVMMEADVEEEDDEDGSEE